MCIPKYQKHSPSVGYREFLRKLCLEVKDCLKVFSPHIYVVHVDLEDEPGCVIDKNAWIVSRHSPIPADNGVPELLIPRPEVIALNHKGPSEAANRIHALIEHHWGSV
jgi:hypothetical protein